MPDFLLYKCERGVNHIYTWSEMTADDALRDNGCNLEWKLTNHPKGLTESDGADNAAGVGAGDRLRALQAEPGGGGLGSTSTANFVQYKGEYGVGGSKSFPIVGAAADTRTLGRSLRH